jgi:hypothetical protein
MSQIPLTEFAAVVRTDFSAVDRWRRLKKVAEEPPDPFISNLVFLDDTAFDGKKTEQIIALLPEDYPHGFIFIADDRALREEDFPCLVVDLFDGQQSFRALARELASIENNLSIANMGFEEFAGSVGNDGVFRGF